MLWWVGVACVGVTGRWWIIFCTFEDREYLAFIGSLFD
jgi:hypothetical protein